MKKAFTLIEVNLAILVMAGGILSVVVLYSLGFRETRQCREDLSSAAYADAVLGPLVGALSTTKLSWSEFDGICDGKGTKDENGLVTVPGGGWGGYLSGGKVVANDAAFNVSVDGVSISKPANCVSGLVISHEKGSGLIKIGFRSAKKLDALLAAPLYYTEVRFQGVQE